MESSYRQLRDLYLQSLDLPASARAQFAQERLRGLDPGLRAELERLWAQDELPSAPAETDLERELQELGSVQDFPLLLEELAGPYRIVGTLGRGGASEVYHAEHLETGQEVALKVLHRLPGSTQLHDRHQRELDALTRLRHPSVARLLGSGTIESRWGARPYVAMELVDGLHAGHWADQAQPTQSELLDVFTQITAAVAAAHRLQIVHRDLKPANILVDRWNRPRVLDFGLSRMHDADAATLTYDGQLLGTPGYMSPEQALGRHHQVGPSSDVYALGLIALRLWGSRDPLPITALSLPESLAVVAAGITTPLRELLPELAPGLRRVLEVCLRLDPPQRYADANELLLDLQRLQRGRRPRLRRVRPRLAPFAVAALVLVATVGVWSLRDLLRPAPQLPTQSEIVGALPRVDELVQLGARSESDLRAAIALTRELEADLHRVPRDEWTPWIERFLYWRRGEAHYFLGTQLREPREYEAALSSWFLADLIGSLPEPSTPWPGGAMSKGNVEQITHQRPAQAMALAHGALAFHRTPMLHLAKAMELREKSLRILARLREAPGANYREIPAQQVDYELAFLIQDTGDNKCELARLRGDEQLLRRGIAMMLYVQELGLTQRAEPATAARHAALGRAYATLVEWGAGPAQADSAMLWLRRALDFRSAGYNLALHAQTLGELARTLRVAGASPAEVDALRSALDDAYGQLAFQGQTVDAALCALTLAELELTFRTPAALERARDWLDRSRTLADEGPFPCRAARWYLLTARERALRAAGDPIAQADARSALAAARARVPRSEDPPLHALLDAEEAALRR